MVETIAECIEHRSEQWSPFVAAEIEKIVVGMKNSEEETLERMIELAYNDTLLDEESSKCHLNLALEEAKKHNRISKGLKTIQQNGGHNVRVINGTLDESGRGEQPNAPRALKNTTPSALYDPQNPVTLILDGVHTMEIEPGSIILDVAKMDAKHTE